MTVEHTSRPAHSAEQVIAQRGAWWLQPVLVVVGLGAFVLYSLWAIFLGADFLREPYLSPFYSPLLHIGFWPLSPALLVMWIPLGFRATCYYYRKAYWRSFFWDPPNCAIDEARTGPPRLHRTYQGERAFPQVLLNSHRWWLYGSTVVLAFLWYDTALAFSMEGRLHVGLGSLILLANVILLTAYSATCHSLRHIVGGGLDCFSCTRWQRARHGLWRALSLWNPKHGTFAWLSLGTLFAADLYVKLLIAGVIADPHVLF